MSKIELAEALQSDINDLKGVFNYKDYGLTEKQIALQARAIMLNLENHIEELIKESLN